MRAKEGVDQRFMKNLTQSGMKREKENIHEDCLKKSQCLLHTSEHEKNIFIALSEMVLDNRGGYSPSLLYFVWWTMTKMADKSEVCVWLSEDKKISQSLQQKQHQSEQDEDDSLL